MTTDISPELAELLPDTSTNNEPNVWFDTEANSWVYRVSSVGNCELQLALFRQGVEGDSPPASMQARFADGHLHEPTILAEIQKLYSSWKVHPKDPLTGAQYETEYLVREPTDERPGIVIRGHIDGLAINPAMYPDSRICEAKALSRANFEKFVKAQERGTVWDQYPYYRDSISLYMASLEVPAIYAVKNKDSGQFHVFEIEEPPGDVDALVTRVRVIDARVERGAIPTECDIKSWPCFVAGTLVLAEDGYKPIEEIRVGESVLTHRGRWQMVTNTSTSQRATRRVATLGGETDTTDNHPFLTCHTGTTHVSNAPDKENYRRWLSDPEWTFAEKLTSDHLVGLTLPPVTSAADEWPLELWVLAGRWVADGWFSSAKYADGLRAPIISCGYSKVERFEDFVSAAGVHAGRADQPTAVRYRFARSEFTEMIEELNFGEYAHGKRIPVELLCARPEIVSAFLEGYLSGDGYFHPQGYWSASTVSEELAYGLSLLHQRMTGVMAGLSVHRRSPTTTIEGRRVNQRPGWSVRFVNGIGCWQDDNGTTWRRVRGSIPSGRIETVYDIEVDEDESFIANGMIVHNCPMWRHHPSDTDDDPEAIMAAALGQTQGEDYDVDELEVLCREYAAFREAEKTAKDGKKNAGVTIAERYLVNNERVESAGFTVKLKQHTWRGLDEQAMKDDGIDVEQYRIERVTDYPDVRAKRRK